MKKFLLFASVVAVLASCSKEMTEDLAAPTFEGTDTIYAGYAGDETTRTYIDSYLQYQWSAGDALGVFDAEAGMSAKSIQFSWVEGNKFSGSLKSFTGKTYFGYYPWNRATKLTTDGEIKNLYINDTQSYNFVNEEAVHGTFAATEAPAVAYCKELAEDGAPVFTFHPVVAYLRVPVYGQGTVKTVAMKVTDKGGNDVMLSGEFSVDVSGLKDGKALTETEVSGAKYSHIDVKTFSPLQGGNTVLTLDCGQGVPVSDDITKPTYFWFVVPANLNLAEAKVTITITGVNDEEKQEFERQYDATNVVAPAIFPGRLNNVQEAVITTENGETTVTNQPFHWIEYAKDAYLINNEEDFIKYVYAATTSPENITAKEADSYKALVLEDNNLKTGLIVAEELDFTTFEAGNAHDKYNKDKYLDEAVYNWYYKTNSNAIKTIGGGAGYSLVGNTASGNPVVIKGLKVKGNGIFTVNGTTTADVKNITFDNATVTVPATITDNAYFVAQNTYYCNFSDVHINGGILVSSAEKTAIFDVVQSCSLNGKVLTIDNPVTGAVLVANELDVYAGDEGKEVYNQTITDKYFTTDGVKFGVIVSQSKGVVVEVPTEANAAAYIKAMYIGNETDKYAAAQGWSSVMAEGTSYWTGFVPTDGTEALSQVTTTKVVTAEALARFAKTGCGQNVTLTNDIVLSHSKLWVADGTSGSLTIKGNGKTISTFNLGKFGLFGNLTTTIENLKVTNGFVNVEAKDAKPYLFANTGVATNVTVERISYKIPANAKIVDNVVAGFFYEADIETAGKTTGSFALTVDPEHKYSDNYKFDVNGGDIKFAQYYACVGVELGAKTYEVNANVANAFGLYNFYCTDNNNHDDATDIVFASNRPDVENITYRWDATRGSIGNKHTVYFKNKGQARTDNYVWYEGILSDVASVSAAASRGENVTFANDLNAAVSGTQSSPAVAVTQNGGTINGAGKTLANTAEKMVKTGYTFAITTTGGTIKNLTIEGPGRHIGGATLTMPLTVEGCDLGKGGAYWANIGNAGNQDVKFVGCVLQGWASFVNTKSLTFDNCTFNPGNYWSSDPKSAFYNEDSKIVNNAIAIYGATTFIGCNFSKDFSFDVGDGNVGGEVTIKDCKIDGVLVTKVSQLTNNVPEKIIITIANTK